jgi:lipopolysaccharide heptosyltransferase II
LCVRLDAMGDVLMTTPAIRALKESGMSRQITLLTSPAGASIAEHIPEVDDALVYEAPWMKHSGQRSGPPADFAMIEKLAEAKFDAAVIFTVFSQNPLPAALLCYLAGIPLRLAHCRENPYQLLTHWVTEREPQEAIRHEVRRQLDLVASIGAATRDEHLSLAVSRDAVRRVRSWLSHHAVSTDRPWLVVHPGATAPSRRYPPEMFAAALSLLMERDGLQVIFTGSAEEQPLIASIQQRLPYAAVSLAGELKMAEFTALLAVAPLLLSNNTGPVHMAAALGTPVVDLYALTNPQHTPWMVPQRVLFHDVPCRNCFKSVCPQEHHHCLRLIEPETVADAVIELWQETHAFRSTSLSNQPSRLAGVIEPVICR